MAEEYLKVIEDMLNDEFKKVPKGVLLYAKKNKNGFNVVYSSVTRKTALSPESLLVKKAFKRLLKKVV
jgi:hypothetical protein